MVKQNKHIILILGLILLHGMMMNDWDNPYRRPIIGDAKGYYAYLPAVFIYQDFEFKFVSEIERRYYPEDGSLAKNFLVEQPNGTTVNKCFPGVSIFYLPFFLLAYFLSFLFGLPLDGYAPLFQWSIAAAHFFYFGLALFFIDKTLKNKELDVKFRFVALLLLTFGSNVFFYLVYDFSVAHVFGFFGTSLFIWFLQKFSVRPSWNIIGSLLVLLALLVITRPTNLLILLAVPLFVKLSAISLFVISNLHFTKWPWLKFSLALAIIAFPMVLWKIQTGMWLIYSYGDETLNFRNPNFIKFLFSPQKGWWFWSPIMLFMTVVGFVFYWKETRWKGLYFVFIVCFISYIFSCWWMWTFGGGLGQRPMIDFYPIIFIAFALGLSKMNWRLGLLLTPFLILNIVQAHQINKFILIGGQTTWADYKAHFFQLKRNAPHVPIPDSWVIWSSSSFNESQILNSDNHFSKVIMIDSLPVDPLIFIRTVVSGQHESSNLALIISDNTGEFYEARYPGNALYRKARQFEYKIDLPNDLKFPLRVYFWNHDTDERSVVESMDVFVFLSSN